MGYQSSWLVIMDPSSHKRSWQPLWRKKKESRHIKCAPYHPATNGLAETFVQSVMQALKASQCVRWKESYSETMRFPATYWSIPHATTVVAPCSLFRKRSLRTRFDMLRPDHDAYMYVVRKQAEKKIAHDCRAQDREWFLGQQCW